MQIKKAILMMRNAILWAVSGEQWAVSRKFEFLFFKFFNEMYDIDPMTVENLWFHSIKSAYYLTKINQGPIPAEGFLQFTQMNFFGKTL
jgi:hypothetical protein